MPNCSPRRRSSTLVGIVGVVVLVAVAACTTSGSGERGGGGGSSPGPATSRGTVAATPPPGTDASSVSSDGATTTAVSPSGRLRLATMSTRADMVTGGDVLVVVSTSDVGALDGLRITRDGVDVTNVFAPDRGQLVGVVDGLTAATTLTASVGDDTVRLTVVDHPLSGPVFSGPHQQPFVCKTATYGLGVPLDADCSVATQTTWSYVGRDRLVHPLAKGAPVPADVATTSVNGADVPFVIRQEAGVINRSVYWITTLDPSIGAATMSAATSSWNKRLLFRFGGGCSTTYSQGFDYATHLDTDLLGRGYAIATATLDTFQSACNATVSAETAMMVREHFIEAYGRPAFTIGDGGSGGAMQQLLIAQNYPGLLDGLVPSLPFPDLLTTLPSVTDCGLLDRYWATPAGARFTDAQRAAVEGYESTQTCTYWEAALLETIDPTKGCDPSLQAQVFDPVRNPTGVRCTVQDSNVTIFGRDAATGWANRPLDNTGVQYGLDALHAGTITVDQFLDLNEHVGGYDIDGRYQPARMTASEDAVRTAYAAGQVVEGGALHDVPILMRSLYTDPLGDFHDRLRPFALRERMRGADGSADPNVVLWTFENTNPDLFDALRGDDSQGSGAIVAMDRWLTNTATTDPEAPWSTRLTRALPADAGDQCIVGGRVVVGGDVYAAGPCHDRYPVHEDPRTAAGEPTRNDVLKCALRPVAIDEYGVAFTDAQAARVHAIFPDGVCDWTKPGVGAVAPTGTWQSFG